MKRIALVLVASLSACSGAEPPAAKASGKPANQAEPAVAVDPPTPSPDKTEVAASSGVAAPVEADSVEADPVEADPVAADPLEPVVAPAGEIAIQPWASVAHTSAWRLAAEPSDAVAFVNLYAGVLGQAGTSWVQLGADGQLGPVTMDREPQLPVLGSWPSDAWFVESRTKAEDDFEIIELRLMKLRGNNRWVPQVFDLGGGDQWFHPGTDHEWEPHVSTRSGMLVYNDEFESITRVAGKHPAPEIGEHRGQVIDFLESGTGKVYVISLDGGTYYAQVDCEDEECVAASAMKLPLSDWKFGLRVPRGKQSTSMLATSGAREFILHFRKGAGWLLDELPAGERPSGIWSSEEGGLWTLAGEHLRWRDTESVWHEVALPEGLSGPSIALTEDHKEVWLAGKVGGATKVFATAANAPVPAAAP